MKSSSTLVFPQAMFDRLHAHLFPGDGDEYAAVILAGVAQVAGKVRFLARELYVAAEGVDHVRGEFGYKMIKAEFIRPLIRRAREQRLAYIGIHNHGGRDSVQFSQDDLNSHERGHPALLELAEGMPVGAAVFAKQAVAGDIWFPDGTRHELTETLVIGSNFTRLYSRPTRIAAVAGAERYDRQVQMFGAAGQALLCKAKVAVIGAGGVGSLLVEYLARLGVGNLVVIDPDHIDGSNLSRVIGSLRSDIGGMLNHWPLPAALKRWFASGPRRKIDIAKRVARQANPDIGFLGIAGDFSAEDVTKQVLDCDFLFLAADSMRARLVFNAVAQQYYIPGIQIGSLVAPDKDGHSLESVFSVTRWVAPGTGCLWCSNAIDRHLLAVEAKTDSERADQDYGSGVTNPSVITLNAVGASMAANDFLFSYLGLFSSAVVPTPRRFQHLARRVIDQLLVPEAQCTECSAANSSRLGRGDAAALPTIAQS